VREIMINKKAFKIMVMSTAFLLVVVCLSYARTDHREYKGATLEECRDCHSGAGVMSNHGAFFVKEHRLLAQKAGSNRTRFEEKSVENRRAYAYDTSVQLHLHPCDKGEGGFADL
jgi:hypothetical protein